MWDGPNDGFSALVNYHKLDKSGLERLIYTYLGDWIRTQQAGMAAGEDGAQEGLVAAENLKTELEHILQGEKPYDIGNLISTGERIEVKTWRQPLGITSV